MVRIIQNFQPPSWFLDAILYFSTTKRLWVMKFVIKNQPMNILSPNQYWMFPRVYIITFDQRNCCCIHNFWSPLNLNTRKCRIFQFFLGSYFFYLPYSQFCWYFGGWYWLENCPYVSPLIYYLNCECKSIQSLDIAFCVTLLWVPWISGNWLQITGSAHLWSSNGRIHD